MTTLNEGFPCFFLSCKANARVKPAKTEHDPHSSKFLCCSMYSLFCVVLCIVCVYMCTVLLPPGSYPIAVKYIVSYHIISITLPQQQWLRERPSMLYVHLLSCFSIQSTVTFTGQLQSLSTSLNH